VKAETRDRLRKRNYEELHLCYWGCNPQAVHLSFVRHVLQAEAVTSGGGVPDDILVPPTFKKMYGIRLRQMFDDKHARRDVLGLLRYCGGQRVWRMMSEQVDQSVIALPTFINFCRWVDVRPLQLLTLPTTVLRVGRLGQLVTVPLHSLMGRWGI
jgi:hypothetical protein